MSDIPDSPPIAGKALVVGKHGPQVIESSGRTWNEEAEARFFDHLAASCNVVASAKAAGFTATAVYAHRRRDAEFARRWQAALETGTAHLEALLLQRAIETLEGFAPDPTTPIPPMTVREVLTVLGHHRREVEGGPRSRRQWARRRSLDEVRDSILRKLEAVAPAEAFESAPADAPGSADGAGDDAGDDSGDGGGPR